MVNNPIYDGPVYESVQLQFDTLRSLTTTTQDTSTTTSPESTANSPLIPDELTQQSQRVRSKSLSSKECPSLEHLAPPANGAGRSTSVSVPATKKKGMGQNKSHLVLSLTGNDAPPNSGVVIPQSHGSMAGISWERDENYMIMSPASAFIITDSLNGGWGDSESTPVNFEKHKE